MKIADVMTRDVRVIQPDRTVREAARLMDEMNVGVLPVCNGLRLVGMITDRAASAGARIGDGSRRSRRGDRKFRHRNGRNHGGLGRRRPHDRGQAGPNPPEDLKAK